MYSNNGRPVKSADVSCDITGSCLKEFTQTPEHVVKSWVLPRDLFSGFAFRGDFTTTSTNFYCTR